MHVRIGGDCIASREAYIVVRLASDENMLYVNIPEYAKVILFFYSFLEGGFRIYFT